jgi:excisionase family DNA binding protein
MSELTVKEFAAVERVSERTVWHWIAKGAVSVRRTPGGGVRIPDTRTLPAFNLQSSEVSSNPSA